MVAHEVHIWSVALEVASGETESFAEILARDERERLAGFGSDQLRRRFLVARGSLRVLLGRYLQMPGEKLKFAYSQRGKPSLTGKHADTLQFNLGHSGDLALIAVSRVTPVGVDVEQVRPMRDADRIAQRFFSESEAGLLRTVTEKERDAAFFRLWTRKEAFLKATGDGLSNSLPRVEVSFLADENCRVKAVAGDRVEAAEWHLASLQPAADFVGAVAIRQRGVEVKCWRFKA